MIATMSIAESARAFFTRDMRVVSRGCKVMEVELCAHERPLAGPTRWLRTPCRRRRAWLREGVALAKNDPRGYLPALSGKTLLSVVAIRKPDCSTRLPAIVLAASL